uniref:Luciferase 3 n=1 Tax=Odontosyllis undecimdonta TaxID=2203390 RepID=A0A5A4PWD9_9ANNE|nr:luciferase 3 [Odontosyllis undecimdonta]
MKVGLYLGLGFSLAVTGLALEATIGRCLKLVPNWSEQDCTPFTDTLYAEFNKIWAGDYLDVFAEWLTSVIPPEWTDEEVMAFCVKRECHTNQAMVDYMHIYGNAPYCMEQTPEQWLDDRFWIRCEVKANRSRELQPSEFAVYFCYESLREKVPTVDCPADLYNPERQTVQQLQKAKEIIGDADEGSEQWWVGVMRSISDASKDNNGHPAMKYGWIINMQNDTFVVPLWSPYQGPTVPIASDITEMKRAITSGGTIHLGGVRSFNCATDDDCAICPEFGNLGNPLENIVMVQQYPLLFVGLTSTSDGITLLKDALIAEANKRWKSKGI